MSHSKLVMMANQIGKAFAAQGEARAIVAIARHIELFWDPRMRAQINEHIDAGGEGLDASVLKALQSLRKPEPSTTR